MALVNVRQGSPEWLALRRELITATDIPAILGLSAWRAEADVAADKLGTAPDETPSIRMRLGSFLEPLILEEYERATGREAQHIHGIYRHPRLTWAGASPDARTRYGARRLVELKYSGSRSRWADGLPQEYEAQVRWQLGVMGWEVADVAALVGDELTVYEVRHDQDVFDGMVIVAEDFRARLAAGGPFEHSAASVRRAFPSDDGSEAVADDEVDAAVTRLQEVRAEIERLEASEELLKTAIQARMGDHAVLHATGWDVVWRQSKPGSEVRWQALADELMNGMAGTERDALLGRFTTARKAMRPFRVVPAKEK